MFPKNFALSVSVWLWNASLGLWPQKSSRQSPGLVHGTVRQGSPAARKRQRHLVKELDLESADRCTGAQAGPGSVLHSQHSGTRTELHPHPHPLVRTPLLLASSSSQEVQTPRGCRADAWCCSKLVIPHPNPMFLDMNNTTRGPSSPGAVACSWVLGQVFPSPAVIQSFILANGKFLQLFPCFMSAELSASLAPVLGQRPQQRGRMGSAG